MNTQKDKEQVLKTRKGYTMTKMTALYTALSFIPKTETEARETIENMICQLSRPHKVSDEAKAKAKAKRKEATAKARAELIAKVVPVLRKYLATDVTAKELFELAKDELPADFTPAKVQNILLREMAAELVKTEAKGKANTYRLA